MTDEIRHRSVRPPQKPATRAVRAGIASDLHHGAVVPPIHLSSTFAFEGFGKKRLYDYTRTGNPTREYLAKRKVSRETADKFRLEPDTWLPTGMLRTRLATADKPPTIK